MLAGLLTTTMSSSMCTIVMGSLVTGTSCLKHIARASLIKLLMINLKNGKRAHERRRFSFDVPFAVRFGINEFLLNVLFFSSVPQIM